MSDHKPRFLLRSSPLVAGGKARLMSNKKVEPKPATPREVSRIEAQGYTTEPHKGYRASLSVSGRRSWTPTGSSPAPSTRCATPLT
jgi:hypothetical protein